MKINLGVTAFLFLGVLLPQGIGASTFSFDFVGGGINGTIHLTYGASTDAKYPSAFEVTGISGTFSDSNHGLNINQASITSLVAINHATPETTNLLAPNDFSRFAVATGLPHPGGTLSYDNLFYPAGSPQTASDYPLHGGFLDIYGLLFNIGNNEVVDFWSNGFNPSTGVVDYGVAVATSSLALDYVGSSVTPTPEPGVLSLLAGGFLAIALLKKARQFRDNR